eukprot:2372954-Rhodomonas_salina.1
MSVYAVVYVARACALLETVEDGCCTTVQNGAASMQRLHFGTGESAHAGPPYQFNLVDRLGTRLNPSYAMPEGTPLGDGKQHGSTAGLLA